MYKPDEDIDRLSRDAAEHYHAPGKPSWDALQQILDKELPQEKEKKRRGFFFFWLLLGLSVAGTGLWFGITVNNKHPKTTITENAAVESSKQKTIVAGQPENTNSASPKSNASADAGSAVASNDVSKKDETAAVVATTTNKVLKNNNPTTENSKNAATAILPNKSTPGNAITEKKIKPKTIDSKTATAIAPDAVAKDVINLKVKKDKRVLTAKNPFLLHSKKIKNNTTAAGNEEENSTIAIAQSPHKKSKLAKTGRQSLTENVGNEINNGTAKQNKRGSKKGATVNSNPQAAKGNEILTGIAANNNSSDNTKGNTRISSESDDEKTAQIPDTAVNKIASAKPVAVAPVAEQKDSAVVARKKVKTKSKPERAINFGIVAGIDKSTVKFTDGDHAGYNIGLTGGYQFNKHWSVSTGVVYTKKNYKLNGNDFHPPAHYWTQYVDLQKVEGYCKMWEIPLVAKYTFNPGAKTAFFASAGLSSYFMTRQYYDYSYKNTMGWPMTGAWATDSTFKHVFSILDLSVGFEKQVGKHLNLQVEPYAKVPLGGIGFGDMRLSSFGINFSIQYRHKLKR